MRTIPTILSLTSLTLGLALAGPLQAGEAMEGREQRIDRRDTRDDRQDVRGDKQDIRQVDRIVEDWHDARATGNKRLERDADDRLAVFVREQLKEGQQDVKEAKTEVAQTEAERGRSRREQRGSAVSGAPYQSVDDSHDLRDDRRDVRDDRHDAAAVQNNVARMRQISDELRAMQPAFDVGTADGAMYTRKSQLLRELQGLARTELAQESQEREEDRGERREDRRERVER